MHPRHMEARSLPLPLSMGKFWCFGKEEAEGPRSIPINLPPNKAYDVNFTSTTKYNLLTFFPKALFEQYRWGGTPRLD